MIKTVFRLNRKRFLLVILGYILFNILWFGANQIYGEIMIQRDQNTMEMVRDISYTEEHAENEIKILEKYGESTSLSNRSLGYLYKALAKLNYMTGDDPAYNEQVGKAFHYLYQSGEYNELADLYTQYMGKLYANGAYKRCEELFAEMNKKLDITKCNTEVQIAYYLGAADVEEMLGNNEKSFEDIEKANVLIAKVEKYPKKLVDQAKSDMLLIRNYINAQEYEKASEKMSKYSEDDTLGLESDNMFLVCDYKMPYFEMLAKLSLHENKYDYAAKYTKKYIEYCDKYNFRRMKLNLLSYFEEKDAFQTIPEMEQFGSVYKELTAETLNEFSEQYGKYLLTEIDDNIEKLRDKHMIRENHQQIAYITFSIGFFALLIFVFIDRLMAELRIDGLTRLRNRKSYEEDRERMYRKKEEHFVLLLDIDDFKNVNDTFGHQTGDQVLIAISTILHHSENGYIRCYRYGGEELCVISKHKQFETILALAEQLRITIENEVSTPEMKITVSGGLAYSSDGGTAFRRADTMLYKAKANGKNQIVYEENLLKTNSEEG